MRRTLYRVTQENSIENSVQNLSTLYTKVPGVKIVDSGLHFIFSLTLFLFFYFSFIFYFLFLEQLGLGFISHAVTSVTNRWHSHKIDHRTWENGVEGSGIK